jgi:hypothetical protein
MVGKEEILFGKHNALHCIFAGLGLQPQRPDQQNQKSLQEYIRK